MGMGNIVGSRKERESRRNRALRTALCYLPVALWFVTPVVFMACGPKSPPVVKEPNSMESNRPGAVECIEIKNDASGSGGESSSMVYTSDEKGRAPAERAAQPEPEKQAGEKESSSVPGSSMVPSFMAARVASSMEPKTVAKLSEGLPVDKAVDITMRLDRDFLAEVTKHLNPKKASLIIEKCPDELLVDVARRLLKQKEYRVLGALADHLSPEKLRILAVQLVATENIQVAGHMKNRALIGKVIVTFPDAYMIELIKGSAALNSYALAAEVIQEMDQKRRVDLLGALSKREGTIDAFLKEVVPHMAPEECAAIIEESSDQTLITLIQGFTAGKEHRLLASLADRLSSEKLTVLASGMPPSDIIQVADHMRNRTLISRIVEAFSDEYLIALMDESAELNRYRLAAEVIQEMKNDRVIRLLCQITQKDFPIEVFIQQTALYLKPEKAALIRKRAAC